MDALQRKCAFCDVENPPYTCPRCHEPYCNLVCYQCVDHQICSENFYKEWVKGYLTGPCDSDNGKARMVEILKKLHSQEQDESVLDSDDSDDNQEVCGDSDVSNLNARLLSQLAISSPDDLWNTLTLPDREAVRDLLDTQEILVWSPWWHYKEPARKLVTEVDAPEGRLPSSVPNVTRDIPRLHKLTSRKPCDTIQFQVLNVLAAYVFTARHFNGEHVDESKDSAQMIIELSSALQNSSRFSDAVGSVYHLQGSEQGKAIQGKALSLVFDDLCEILKGPKHDHDCHYVSAALSDIKELLTKGKENKHSGEKKILNLAIKKVDYLLSWNQDYGCTMLRQHIPSLQIEIASITENTKSLEKCIPMRNESAPHITEL